MPIEVEATERIKHLPPGGASCLLSDLKDHEDVVHAHANDEINEHEHKQRIHAVHLVFPQVKWFELTEAHVLYEGYYEQDRRSYHEHTDTQ